MQDGDRAQAGNPFDAMLDFWRFPRETRFLNDLIVQYHCLTYIRGNILVYLVNWSVHVGIIYFKSDVEIRIILKRALSQKSLYQGLLTRNPMNGVCPRDQLTWHEIHSCEWQKERKTDYVPLFQACRYFYK